MKINEWRCSWLAPYTWEIVTLSNRQLCEAKNAFHGPTSDGYDSTRKMWESKHENEMTLFSAAELCRKAHRGAPFCFFNGNTFVALMKIVISDLLAKLSAEHAFILRSTIGHHIAGTIDPEDLEKLLAELPEIDDV